VSTILKTHDTLNRRLRGGGARPRGERVTRQPNDLSILEVLHRLGPQTTEALYQLLHPLYRDKHSLLIRLRKLRHEEDASDYGGPLIFYPSQQRRGATLPDNNLAVYHILPRGERLLKNAGLWREHHPTTNNREWKHDFMRSTIIASIALAAKAHGCEFIHHDEVLAGLPLPFAVPEYVYKTDNGKERIRSAAKLRPDGFFALKYANGVKRIFLVEADCGTEPNESDNIERKSHKHTTLSYHSLLSNDDLRRKLFGEARIGVLNVFATPRGMKGAMATHEKNIGNRGTFMLYTLWKAFGDYFRPPPPRLDLFTDAWHRVGQSSFFISQATGTRPQSVPSANFHSSGRDPTEGT
jgi:hypothetical protein